MDQNPLISGDDSKLLKSNINFKRYNATTVAYVHFPVDGPETEVGGEENGEGTVVPELIVVDVLHQFNGPGHLGSKVRVVVMDILQHLTIYTPKTFTFWQNVVKTELFKRDTTLFVDTTYAGYMEFDF